MFEIQYKTILRVEAQDVAKNLTEIQNSDDKTLIRVLEVKEETSEVLEE